MKFLKMVLDPSPPPLTMLPHVIFAYPARCCATQCYTMLHKMLCLHILIPYISFRMCGAGHTTHYDTLQQTETHCSTLRGAGHTTHYDTLQQTETHCSTLQHTAPHCNTLQHTAPHCTTLQHTATHCTTPPEMYGAGRPFQNCLPIA